MHRRSFIRGVVAVAAAACPVCQAVADGTRPAWSYGDATGPERWGTLDPAYAACGSGERQSPIDLAGGGSARLAPIEFAYGTIPARAEDNGHTIEVPVPAGHGIRVDGAAYTLLQFHFHAPSEHRIDGRTFPMELHLVHRDGDGRLAVVGVMLEEGATNPRYAPVFSAIPGKATLASSGGPEISLPSLLPAERDYYRYDGSLTTPGCGEGVTWMVLRHPVPLGREQTARFTALYPHNARPLQPANGRQILRSF